MGPARTRAPGTRPGLPPWTAGRPRPILARKSKQEAHRGDTDHGRGHDADHPPARRRQRGGGAHRHPAGHRNPRRRRDPARPHPRRPQADHGSHSQGRGAAQVRPDHRFRGRGPGARAPRPCRYRGTARLRARPRAGHRGPADRLRPGRRARPVHGLSPDQRRGRHAQLSRRAQLGQLRGHGRPLHRRGDRRRGARRLSQRRRRGAAGARHRLRHGQRRRGLRQPAARALGSRAAPQLRRHPDGRPGL